MCFSTRRTHIRAKRREKVIERTLLNIPRTTLNLMRSLWPEMLVPAASLKKLSQMLCSNPQLRTTYIPHDCQACRKFGLRILSSPSTVFLKNLTWIERAPGSEPLLYDRLWILLYFYFLTSWLALIAVLKDPEGSVELD